MKCAGKRKIPETLYQKDFRDEPMIGLEPMTYALRMRCSTD